MSKQSNKTVYRLPQHSLAKIACYRRYLEIYLNILGNSPFKNIHLYDFFAGEGRDIEGKACSSITTLEVIREHYNTSRNTCKRLSVYLNDYGSSVIDTELHKIERVEKLAKEIPLPSCVKVEYTKENFEDASGQIIGKLNALSELERALCFMDPWGYKLSKPEVLKSIMANGKTELLLFIPICFMHRFAAKALKDDSYIEGKHIEDFITTLFNNDIPDISNQVSFIRSIQKQFKEFLEIPYVDVLFIEKEKNQYFALFFFSNSKRGFQKMLEAKWTIDEGNGQGFSVNRSVITPSLFQNIDHEDYTYLLYSEIKKRKVMSNQEIFDFGLDNNHLPKHSRKVLEELRKEGKIKITTPGGAKPLGFYIEDNHNKKIQVTPIF